LGDLGSGPPKQWWTLETGEEVRLAAWQFASALDSSEGEIARRANFLTYGSQYLGRPITSLQDFENTASLGDQTNAEQRVTGRTRNNLTRTLTDTAMSRFAKSETRVQYTTEGGTPAQQERGEVATDAANALIEQTGGERELRKAALHACVFDLGYVKKIDGEDGPEVEHVPAWEIMYDPADAHRGRPTIQVQRCAADKEALVARFATVDVKDPENPTPEEQKLLAEAAELADDIRSSGTEGMVTADRTPSDQHCLVYEVIRQPVGRKKGRRVVVTSRALCLDEEWTEKDFGGVSFGWSEPLKGAYPESIAAIVSQLQFEIDGIDRRISQVLRLMAVPRYLATGAAPTDEAGGTGIVASQLQGGEGAIGDIIQCPPGTSLTLMTAANILGPELQNRADKLWSRGFEMTGINPQAAIGSRPAGLNSAPAQREWNEINQDRLSLVALDYQQAHVDLARLLLDAIAKIPEYEINLKTTNGRWLKKVKAAQLDLDNADYVIEKFPIGALPTTPTGKIAAAADLLQMKGIDVDEFRDILNFPDLKAKLNIRRASEKAIEKIINKMLSTGQYIAPPDKLDMTYAAKYATARWLDMLGEDSGNQEQMDMLNDWIGDVQARAAKSAPAAPILPAAGVDPTAGTSIAPLTPAPLAPPPPMPPQGAIAA